MSMGPEVIIGGAFGAGILGGLLKNIVWDWLTKRGKGGDGIMLQPKPHCEDHTTCLANIEANKTCLSTHKREYAADNATIQTVVKHIKERLSEGDTQIKEVKKELKGLNDSIVQLTTVIAERIPKVGAPSNL